jgi:chorismate synthase
VLERASARETTARVAAGAVCRRFLREFDITLGSHVVHLGGVDARRPDKMPAAGDLNAAADASPLRTLDKAAETEMIARIDAS